MIKFIYKKKNFFIKSVTFLLIIRSFIIGNKKGGGMLTEKNERARTMIRVRNLRKEYRLEDDTVVALKRINLDIKQGEICCIFGTSGSGKSTLLN